MIPLLLVLVVLALAGPEAALLFLVGVVVGLWSRDEPVGAT